MVNAEYEYIALHRDVGDTELKQGREIREGGNLGVYRQRRRACRQGGTCTYHRGH